MNTETSSGIVLHTSETGTVLAVGNTATLIGTGRRIGDNKTVGVQLSAEMEHETTLVLGSFLLGTARLLAGLDTSCWTIGCGTSASGIELQTSQCGLVVDASIPASVLW